jgi:drug/metabolite transporter (DMT)-like permease
MKLRNLLLLALLAAMWGPSFLFIKVAVADIPPLTLVLGRVGIAAALLYLLLLWRRESLPRRWITWKHIAVMALIHNTIPFVLFSWGEQYIDSALAAILNGTTPIFTILLAHYFTVDDHLTPTKVGGTLLGLVGLAFLIGPALLDGVQVTTWGLLALTAASIFYAVAIIYSRNHLRGLPPLVAPTGQLLLATLYILPVALLVDRPFSLPQPSLAAAASLLALAVLGTAVAFVVYYRLVETADPSTVSMVTYIIPVIGVVLGVLILNEKLLWSTYAGFAFILVGVMSVNGLFKRRNKVLVARPCTSD